MAGVYERCIEVQNKMESIMDKVSDDAEDLPLHCKRLILEYRFALRSFIETVHGVGSSECSRLLSNACNSALTELWCIMVDGQMLVQDCLSNLARRSVKTNPMLVEMSFCLNLQKLYGCIDILKCVYAEAAGKPDSDYATPIPTRELTAKLKRMKTCCEELHREQQTACDKKICFDELCLPVEKGYDMGTFGPVQNHKWFNETVVVRMLPGVNGKLLQSEASRLVSLQHPHLVQVLGYGFEDKTSNGFLVMECLQQNLKTFVQNWSGGNFSGRASLPFAVALPILLEVAMAMKHLHGRDVVHCNLSTENVLVLSVSAEQSDAPEGYVHAKLSIFHLAGYEISKPCSLKTAPEVCTKPADVYCYSEMFVEILGGELARLGSDVEISSLPDQCPTFLICYLKKCLDPNPEERPNFSGICDMLQLCKDIVIRSSYFPSKLPSVNKLYAEALYKLLGFEQCTSVISSGEPFLPQEIFLEVLVHALQLHPTDTELKSVQWKASLLRASQYCGGWTRSSLKISDPMAVLDAIEKNLEKEAIWRLGLCYELGRVVGVDETKAATMYGKASAQGFISAHVDLGLCYAFGRGVDKFRPRADELWMEAIRHQNEDQRPLLSVSELIQSLKTLLLKANRDRSEDNLVRDITTRVLNLSQKSAIGTQLVAGPSYCNISSLISGLQGSSTIDVILGHLAKNADVKKYLQENQVPTRLVPHRVTFGFLDWASDCIEDGVSIFFKFIFRFFIFGFIMTMAVIVPVLLTVFFLTASKFWLAGVFLLLSIMIWLSGESLARIMFLHEFRSIVLTTT